MVLLITELPTTTSSWEFLKILLHFLAMLFVSIYGAVIRLTMVPDCAGKVLVPQNASYS